jgi:hypothetical protein
VRLASQLVEEVFEEPHFVLPYAIIGPYKSIDGGVTWNITGYNSEPPG